MVTGAAWNPSSLETSTATITADDIHVREGGTSGTEMSFSDGLIANLGFETGSNTTEKNFQQFHNKWTLVTGKFSNTVGYIEGGPFGGGSDLGSMTENIMASANDGGWYLFGNNGCNRGGCWLVSSNGCQCGGWWVVQQQWVQ